MLPGCSVPVDNSGVCVDGVASDFMDERMKRCHIMLSGAKFLAVADGCWTRWHV